MELNEILQIALRNGASDIHLKAGNPPIFRVNGALGPLKDVPKLTPSDVERLALGTMNDVQREKFARQNEVDLGYSVPGLGRFRINVFRQRSVVGCVLRAIPFKILSIRELMLPPVIETIALEQRGLILVTGATGSGKSTTLAAMIDFINARETDNIVTIEDPIEFLIRDKNSIINQREIGSDTLSFSQALKSALRQDPDVILVGEMRDAETIETALVAAATGHLVLSTLHTTDASETINRVVSIFPPHHQKQVRLQLASVLRAVISQRLVTGVDGKRRVAAVEVMRITSRIRELIEDSDRTSEIPEAIAQGHTTYGSQTFDQSLMSLVRSGIVTYEDALRNASNPDDFALRFKGISSGSDAKWDDFERPAPGTPAPAAVRPQPGQRPGAPAAAQRPAGQAKPQAAPAASAGGDFKVERF